MFLPSYKLPLTKYRMFPLKTKHSETEQINTCTSCMWTYKCFVAFTSPQLLFPKLGARSSYVHHSVTPTIVVFNTYNIKSWKCETMPGTPEPSPTLLMPRS